MHTLVLKKRFHLDSPVNKALAWLFVGLLSVVFIYTIQNYLKYGDHVAYSFWRSLSFNTVSLLGFVLVIPLVARVHEYLNRYPKKVILLSHLLFSLAIIGTYSLVISLINYSLGFSSKPFHEAFLTKYFLNMALFHWIFYWVVVYTSFRKPTAKQTEYLSVSQGKSKVLCPLSSIMRIEAMDHYVKVFTQEECYLKKISLKSLENELKPSSLVRIHRSHMVNKAFVKRVESRNGTAKVVLQNGATVTVGKTYLSNNDLTTLYSTND